MAITFPATLNQAVAAVSGYTSPTFTLSASSLTIPNGKMATVTSRGGTQPSTTDVHSASRPFSFMVTRPNNIQTLPAVNNSGVLPQVPINPYHVGSRKGMTVLAGQPSVPGYVKTVLGIPAGADLADPGAVSAMVLSHCMLLAQLVSGIIDTANSGEV